jgi:hypothetical protein
VRLLPLCFLLPPSLLAICLLLGCEETNASDAMGFELDHVFVAAPSPSAGWTALDEAGFLGGPSRSHPGQGTASQGIFFENAYLEVLWLTDPGEAASTAIARTRLGERLDSSLEACPFGVSVRVQTPGEAGLPFRTWEYRPPYVPAGNFIPVAASSSRLDEPLVFLLPWRTEPGWDPPDHPNGTARVTGVRIILEETDAPSDALSFLSESGIVDVERGTSYRMEVELDRGRQGKSLDLAPALPLRIAW